MDKIDIVTMSVINNHLSNICKEMGYAMMRTAYSPIFNESLDFSCVIFNKEEDMIAQADFCPAQIGAILFTVRWAIAEIGEENFEPGDVIIHNDPYRGAVHIPEHMVMKPVFYKDQLFGFVANVAHVTEIGGKAPGAMAADAREIYQEGLRLPPVKIMQRGEHVKDVWKIILANHRTPKTTWGDFHAMIGSLSVAEKRLLSLLDRYGVDLINSTAEELINHSERCMRAEIREIPDGEYRFEDCIEDDGITDKPGFIRVCVVIKGDELIADFTGTDPQTEGPANATFGCTASAVYNAIFHLTDPNIPRNSGCYKPIKIIAPPGTMVNVQHPGPDVGGNSENHPRIIDIIFGAIAQVLPDRVAACSGSTGANFLFGGIHPDTGEVYASGTFEGMGWGGTSTHDGNSVTNNYNGNCRVPPVEVFETRYPFLTKGYYMIQDSGGPGKYRGGLGSCRILEVLGEKVYLSALFDRVKVKPWGLFRGKEGKGAGFYVKKRDDKKFRPVTELFGKVSPSKFTEVPVTKGDEIMFITPGGGGYGNPLERDPENVLRDVLEGFVSMESAKENHGVAITRKNGELLVDHKATQRMRIQKSQNFKQP